MMPGSHTSDMHVFNIIYFFTYERSSHQTHVGIKHYKLNLLVFSRLKHVDKAHLFAEESCSLNSSLFKDTQLGSDSRFLWILTGKHVLTVSATEIKRRVGLTGWLQTPEQQHQ